MKKIEFEITILPDGKQAFFVDKKLWNTTDVNGMMMVYEKEPPKPREHPFQDGLVEIEKYER